MERRWLRAVDLFDHGATQDEVAGLLGVSRQSVHTWYWRWRAGGPQALRAAGRAGRKPRLTGAQLDQIEQACWRAHKPTGTTPTCGPWHGSPW
jgi:transposase